MRHPYARLDHAAALAGSQASPIDVGAWGAPVLRRPIAAGGFDAAGPYPMTPFPPGADIVGGLDALSKEGLACVVLVGDPLATPPPADAFDLFRPFKTHHLVRPARYAPSKHHRAEIRRSLARCAVERVSLAEVLPTWTALYGGLIDRHAICGPAAFSPGYFRYVAQMPELVALAARVERRIVAMGLWFAHGDVAYNHLGASSPEGYAVGAGYALYDAAITHFGDRHVINLGGAAGGRDDPADGLARFKRGFADGAVQAHLYGKVLDPARYARLSAGVETEYFPAYRDPSAGEQSRRTASATRSMSAAA